MCFLNTGIFNKSLLNIYIPIHPRAGNSWFELWTTLSLSLSLSFTLCVFRRGLHRGRDYLALDIGYTWEFRWRVIFNCESLLWHFAWFPMFYRYNELVRWLLTTTVMSSDSAGSSSADLDMLGVQVSSWWLTTLGNTCQVKKKCL